MSDGKASASPTQPSADADADATIDHLVALYLTDRPAFIEAVAEFRPISTAAMAAAASAAATKWLAAGSHAEAEAAYQIQGAAYRQANDPSGMIDSGICVSEQMKIRAESLAEYEMARNCAISFAGAARELRRPRAEFTALTIAADAAFFASGQLSHERKDEDARAWMLITLKDCVNALDVVEAGVGTGHFHHFVSLLLAIADRVVRQHWYDDGNSDDKTVVTQSLRQFALALQTYVGTALSPTADLDVVLDTALHLAKLYYSHGNPDSAFEVLSEVLRRCESEDRVDAAVTVSAARYRGERRSIRPSHRMQELRGNHRTVIERFRQTRRSRSGRMQAADTIDETTALMVNDEFAARARRDIAAAFDAAEANKARILLDEMGGNYHAITEPGMAQAALHLESVLLHLEARKETGPVDDEFRLLSRLPFGGLGQVDETGPELDRLEQLYAAHDGGFTGGASPVDLDTATAALQPGEAILTFHIPYEPDDPAGTVLLLLVTPDQNLSIHLPLLYNGDLKTIGRFQADNQQPLDVSPLGNIIAMTRAAIRQGNDADATVDLQQLYRLLIAPLADYGFTPEQFTRLIVVPYGLLHAVPFAALQDTDGHYLAEKVAIVVAPSVSAWTWLATQPNTPADSLLGFADPALPTGWKPLPASRHELDAITGLVPGLAVNARTGSSATESAFRREAPGKGLLHLATHGDFPEEDALDLHRIVLSPTEDDDGLLHAEEIRHLDLSAAQLAVLSICDGGLYRFGPGDEPLGLLPALFAAGVTNVVAPLWEIDDQATCELMKVFYRRLLSAGPAEALQQAAIDLMRGGAPIRDWAGFALMGAGRPLVLAPPDSTRLS